MKPKKQQINWVDCMGRHGWKELEPIINEVKENWKKVLGITSIGYVVYEDKNIIIITTSYLEEDEGLIADPMIISKSAIIKRRNL